MKAGGYTLHQSLTLESAAVVKHAIALARRRGHAQVTPLHMASALLGASPTSGLLKRACLQSHSYPLQCKALELCFNVALNRLPTSTSSSPLVVTAAPAHYHVPSLSNALVAAFKRAQAHQRRGSIESHQQQQQSVLALKVEIEQLVVSILDDPSVSRVMREAGFSSTQVKSNVEKTVSTHRSPPVSSQSKPPPNHFAVTLTEPTGRRALNDDVATVLDAMMDRKKKNALIIVSDSASTAEAVVKEVIETFNKKDVPAAMRLVQFISVPLSTLQNISRDEFETRLGELRSLVKSYMSRGVVLYLGDLNWVATFWSQRDHGYYCPVEYMIMELSRMICGENDEENKRLLWLMGTATPETYTQCRIGRPSLETLWCLHSLRLRPVIGNLALNLSLDSAGVYDRIKEEGIEDFNWPGIKKQLHCCTDCSDNFKKEAHSVITSGKQRKTGSTSGSSLPSWLQQYIVENRKHDNADQECDKIKDLCKKWNSICSSVHRKAPYFLFNLSSPSPPSSTSTSSNGYNKTDDHCHKLHQSLLNWPVIFNEPKKNNDVEVSMPPSFFLPKPDLLSNPNSSPNSASSSEASREMDGSLHKFKEYNSDNLDALSTALGKKVPWQKEIIPEIVSMVLKCRAGMTRPQREDCWLLFSGADRDGKGTVARELSKVVFGSHDSYICISRFSHTRHNEDSEVSNKRARNEHSPYERFVEGMRDNPRRVFYVEDVDWIECSYLKGFKRGMREGSFTLDDGEIVPLRDAIVVFGGENLESKKVKEKEEDDGDDNDGDEEEEIINGSDDDDEEEEEIGRLDLNVSVETNENSCSERGILELVDKQVVFTIQVL